MIVGDDHDDIRRRVGGTQRGALHQRWQARVAAGGSAFVDMVCEEDLELALEQLVPYAHWVTPEVSPKRFDTHFYLARVPADQIAAHDGHENVDSVWITPQQVIEDAREKRRTVIFPTLSNVVRLAQYKTVAQAFEGALNSTIVPIKPWMETRADGKYVCIPTDAGFELTEHRAAGGPG